MIRRRRRLTGRFPCEDPVSVIAPSVGAHFRYCRWECAARPTHALASTAWHGGRSRRTTSQRRRLPDARCRLPRPGPAQTKRCLLSVRRAILAPHEMNTLRFRIAPAHNLVPRQRYDLILPRRLAINLARHGAVAGLHQDANEVPAELQIFLCSTRNSWPIQNYILHLKNYYSFILTQ